MLSQSQLSQIVAINNCAIPELYSRVQDLKATYQDAINAKLILQSYEPIVVSLGDGLQYALDMDSNLICYAFKTKHKNVPNVLTIPADIIYIQDTMTGIDTLKVPFCKELKTFIPTIKSLKGKDRLPAGILLKPVFSPESIYKEPYIRISNIEAPMCKKIGEATFYYNKINRLISPQLETIGSRALMNADIGALDFPNLKKCGNRAFCECHTKYINLPKLQIAGEASFSSLSGVDTLILPSLEEAGEDAFKWSNVYNIALPKLKIVPTYAFECCHKLCKLELDSVEVIETNGIDSSVSLSELNLPSLLELKPHALYGVSIRELRMPNIKVCTNNSIIQCNNLQKIEVSLGMAETIRNNLNNCILEKFPLIIEV